MHSSDFSKYNSYYNYTSTYRIDSDFPQFYQEGQEFIWKQNENFNENFNFTQGKLQLAAAVISNCHASSRNQKILLTFFRYSRELLINFYFVRTFKVYT